MRYYDRYLTPTGFLIYFYDHPIRLLVERVGFPSQIDREHHVLACHDGISCQLEEDKAFYDHPISQIIGKLVTILGACYDGW